MSKYYYDFHIHSCLSPCGDQDMTPNNIAGMATLAGLQIVALTDHNTCKNCPAFFEAAKKNGIIPVAGMELTTAEDIHVVCLFETLEDAMAFDGVVDSRRVKIPNKVDIFGEQLILDGEDHVVGSDECLLSNATTIPIEEVPALVAKQGGICFPAHVDRPANGAIAVLGSFPDYDGFLCCEFRDKENISEYLEKYPAIKKRKILISSDAHYLWHIRDKENFIELDDEPYSSQLVRHNLFCYLRGETS